MAQEWQLGSRYVLQRRIGSGVMGQVWLGHDVDGRQLAFKLLRPEMAEDPTVVARFLQERNLLTVLRNPYVIRVRDLVVEGPRLAIVMEYIAGPSLRGLLGRVGNLPPAEVAWLGARIAEGLAAVHAAGILHRDLKPENVLLEETPEGYVPKLADFGIASLAVTGTGHVGTANVIGTPQYLAPELGDGQPSGQSSDLYALGVTLYEMACGTVPFTADSPVALLRLHADYAPGRPAGIPDPLWDLIAALLSKNPGQRPSDASAVSAWLAQMAVDFADVPRAPHLRVPPTPHAFPEANATQPPSFLAGPATGSSPEPLQDNAHTRQALLITAFVLLVVLGALLGWVFAGGA